MMNGERLIIALATTYICLGVVFIIFANAIPITLIPITAIAVIVIAGPVGWLFAPQIVRWLSAESK